MTSGQPMNMESNVFEVKKKIEIRKKINYINKNINHVNMNIIKRGGTNMMKLNL
jgi:hypothetical protein